MREYAERSEKDVASTLADASIQPHTLKTYTAQWTLWLAYLRDRASGKQYRDATVDDVAGFLAELVTASTSSGFSSVTRARAALAYFYGREHLANPADGKFISRMSAGLRKLEAKDGFKVQGATPITRLELRLAINNLFGQTFTSLQDLE